MDLIEHGNLVSPEAKVPLMIRGLETLYGRKYLPNILKSFDVKKVSDFFQEDKFYLLSDFYHDIQLRSLTDHEYRESIGRDVHRICDVKLPWEKHDRE
jgi:hypothetical protein